MRASFPSNPTLKKAQVVGFVFSFAFWLVRWVFLGGDDTISGQETSFAAPLKGWRFARGRTYARGFGQRTGTHPVECGSGPEPLPDDARSAADRGGHRAWPVRAYEGAGHGGAHPAPPVLGVCSRRGGRHAGNPLPGGRIRQRAHDGASGRRALCGRRRARGAGRPRLAAAGGCAPRAARGRRRGCGSAVHAGRKPGEVRACAPTWCSGAQTAGTRLRAVRATRACLLAAAPACDDAPRCATDDGSFGREPASAPRWWKRLWPTCARLRAIPYDYAGCLRPRAPHEDRSRAWPPRPGVPCEVSMERRMACGIGACLSCVVDTTRRQAACVRGLAPCSTLGRWCGDDEIRRSSGQPVAAGSRWRRILQSLRQSWACTDTSTGTVRHVRNSLG